MTPIQCYRYGNCCMHPNCSRLALLWKKRSEHSRGAHTSGCLKGACVQVPSESQSLEPISSIAFSGDGKLMVAVLAGRIHLLDAFNGTFLHTFLNGPPNFVPAMEATFSPDSQYLLSGRNFLASSSGPKLSRNMSKAMADAPCR